MNALGQALVWCALQVTLVSVVTGLAYAAVRRRGPAARSLVALTGLALSVGLALAAFSPWPRWTLGAPEPATVQSTGGLRAVTADGAVESSAVSADLPVGQRAQAALDPTAAETARTFWNAFVDELERRPNPAEPSGGWGWRGGVALLFGLGVALGLLRLAAAALAVSAYRRDSRRVDDPSLVKLVSRLSSELDCRRPVEVRECPWLASAAMVGWRRPLVLLPVEWTEWSPSELQAVLAHEIAHASRGDFAAWVFAQVGVILHFYHPLVHWLAARLRLDQELAADASAARVAGGRQPYLRILADMALRQSDRLAGWPARAFLPTRRTFLRRIEMLRATKQVPAVVSRRWGAVMVGVLLLAGVAAAGLRGLGGSASQAVAAQAERDDPRQAQPAGRGDRARSAADAAGAELYTAFVPNETQGFMAVRPAALLARDEMKPLAEFLTGTEMQSPFGLPLTEIEQLSLTLIPPVFPPGSRSSHSLFPFGAVTIRTTGPHDFRALIEKHAPNAVRIPAAGREYFRSSGEESLAWFRPDDRTLVMGSVQDIARMVGTGPETGWKRLASGPTANAIAGAHYAVVIETELIQSMFSMYQQANAAALGQADRTRREAGRPAPPNLPAAVQAKNLSLSAFSPLWERAESITFALKVGDKLSIEYLFESKQQADADAVRRTVEALLTLGGNMSSAAAEMARAEAAGQPAEPLLNVLFQLVEELLKNARVEQEGTQVRLATSGSLEAAHGSAVGALTESVKAARAAAKRAQSSNNLKQIALAFHNYHDVYGRFPPAVLYGDDGKTPHSWRVAILPYVDAAPLYNAYLFNEPWDSPNNKRIFEQMPAVFRHPDAPADSTNASYYVLVGEKSIFTGEKAARNEAGVGLRDILDGSSNTLLVVEAQRDIPWAKPEDIPFDLEKDLPKLGGYTDGGFHAALGDGSVRFISDAIDHGILKALITRAGGEVLDSDDLQPPPARARR